MKKAFKKIISAMLAAIMCFSVAACSPATPDGGDTDESVDTMRTQLYVYNFNGGFGTEWLKAAKTRFEAKHAEDELESGKKGVQVIIKANKDSNYGDTFWNNIPKAREEVYFVEGADYYKLVGSELMLDITDAVTSPLSEYGETESIKDKMTAEQQAYYGVGADGKVLRRAALRRLLGHYLQQGLVRQPGLLLCRRPIVFREYQSARVPLRAKRSRKHQKERRTRRQVRHRGRRTAHDLRGVFPSVRLHKGKEGYSYSMARRVVLRLCADDFQHVRSRLRGQRAVDAQLRIRQRNRKAGYVAG